MKNLIRTTLVLFTSLLLGVGSAHAFIGSMAIGMGQANEVGKVEVEFSADAEFETEEGQFKSKINYKDDKLRDTMNMAGQTMTTITRFDLDKIWVLMGQGMYMENEIGQSEQSPDYRLVERTIVGEENVNGYDTTKYKTVYETSRGKYGGFTWFTDDKIAVKGFIISEENGEKQRLMFNLTNVKIGPQSSELFDLPPGAKPFSMPKFNMKNMQGMQGIQNAPAAAGGSTSDSMNDAANAPAMSAPASQPQAGDTSQDPSIAAEAAGAAKEGAREATVEESKQTAKDAVKKGFRGLFGK